MTSKRILLVASAGGHWVQLARLSPAFEMHETLYVTTFKGTRAPIGDNPTLRVRDASQADPFGLILLSFQMLFLMLKFRPSVVVTTGAAPGLIALRLGLLFKAKTIWIDSIANSEEISLSCRLAARHADLWLTQWPHLVDQHPGLRYYGAVL